MKNKALNLDMIELEDCESNHKDGLWGGVAVGVALAIIIFMLSAIAIT